MERSLKLVMILFVPLVWGCNLITGSVASTEASMPTTSVTSDTPAAAATVEATTDTPGATTAVETTDTPIPSVKPLPFVTPNSTTVQLPGFMNNMNNVSQYFSPVGQPVKSWNDVPIMSQAIAAQDWNNGVYSYRANATLNQAVAFYSKFNPPGSFGMPPGTGFAGTGANAIHNATYMYPGMVIYIASYDNDPGHVIVVISK